MKKIVLSLLCLSMLSCASTKKKDYSAEQEAARDHAAEAQEDLDSQ